MIILESIKSSDDCKYYAAINDSEEFVNLLRHYSNKTKQIFSEHSDLWHVEFDFPKIEDIIVKVPDNIDINIKTVSLFHLIRQGNSLAIEDNELSFTIKIDPDGGAQSLTKVIEDSISVEFSLDSISSREYFN